MKIEDCIGKRNINAAQLARLTGYSSTHVQRVLNGVLKPNKKFLIALEAISFDQIEKKHKRKVSFGKRNDL